MLCATILRKITGILIDMHLSQACFFVIKNVIDVSLVYIVYITGR